jgi:hypothetical protein
MIKKVPSNITRDGGTVLFDYMVERLKNNKSFLRKGYTDEH